MSTIPVFVISLRQDLERRHAIERQVEKLERVEVTFIDAVWGRSLPDSACLALTSERNWVSQKGTIACFLSHVATWEAIAGLPQRWAVVLEDDTEISRLDELNEMSLPEDFDIVFINDRMEVPDGKTAASVIDLAEPLRKLNALQSGSGGDGYLLTPSAAQKLVAACETDLYYGHVDGRLLRYATSRSLLSGLTDAPWIAHVLSHHHHPQLKPALGILKGYSLSRALVHHRGMPSTRQTEDDRCRTSVPHARTGPAGSQATRPPSEAGGIPIRYWNRIRNVGDALNPS